eukprot:358341-Chlamydomonas_euryale.AAC.1
MKPLHACGGAWATIACGHHMLVFVEGMCADAMPRRADALCISRVRSTRITRIYVYTPVVRIYGTYGAQHSGQHLQPRNTAPQRSALAPKT